MHAHKGEPLRLIAQHICQVLHLVEPQICQLNSTVLITRMNARSLTVIL